MRMTSVINGARLRARLRTHVIAMLPRVGAWLTEAVSLMCTSPYENKEQGIENRRIVSLHPLSLGLCSLCSSVLHQMLFGKFLAAQLGADAAFADH